jgi:hypothetical protein
MTHVLIMLGLLAASALLLLVAPLRACRSCARHRGRPCPRCGGSGRRFRLGAQIIHRGAVTARRSRRRS